MQFCDSFILIFIEYLIFMTFFNLYSIGKIVKADKILFITEVAKRKTD